LAQAARAAIHGNDAHRRRDRLAPPVGRGDGGAPSLRSLGDCIGVADTVIFQIDANAAAAMTPTRLRECLEARCTWRIPGTREGSRHCRHPCGRVAVFRRAILTPFEGGSASNIDPLNLFLLDCLLFVEAVRAWLAAAGITEGPVFRPIAKGGRVTAVALSDRSVAAIVKHHCRTHRARSCGLCRAQSARRLPDYRCGERRVGVQADGGVAPQERRHAPRLREARRSVPGPCGDELPLSERGRTPRKPYKLGSSGRTPIEGQCSTPIDKHN
jgi:hypothetical protein